VKSVGGEPVVLVGARGFIGRLHAEIHRSLGNAVVEIDIAEPVSQAELDAIPWRDAIVDVCTPTAVHTASIRWGYEHGARRFLVEKPATRNYVDWRACLLDVPEAQIFVAHSYMFSRAFEVMFDACPTVVSMSAAFDKDRAGDDLRLRGADAGGRLADVFQIEVPHAFAMVLAVQPALELLSATYTRYGERAPGSVEPTRCEARFAHSTLPEVLVTSDLRAPRCRLLELTGDDGRRVGGYFPLSAALPDCLVYSVDAHGRRTTLFEGRDDLLRATLVAGLKAMRSGAVPWLASAQFAGVVLARIAEARRMAEADGRRRGRDDVSGAAPTRRLRLPIRSPRLGSRRPVR
jgi:predicted dehydrogenase